MKNEKDNFYYTNIYISIFLVILFTYITVIMICLLRYSWGNVTDFLDKLYFNDSIKAYLINNKESFIGFIFLYLIFLGYVSKAKGLVFSDNNKYSLYIYPIITIYKGLSFFILIFLIYIWGHIFEFISIIFVTLLSILNGFILNLYIQIRGDYKGICNYLLNGRVSKKKIMFELDKLTKHEFFTYIFSTLLPHGKYVLVMAFIIIPIGIIDKFNLISILYIHLTFILIYVSISLMTNKFSGLVNIKFDGKEKKNLIIIDQDETRYFLRGEKETYIVNKSNVEYILLKNTDIK